MYEPSYTRCGASGGKLFLENDPYTYGNDVIRRLVYLPSDAKKSWIDVETKLPNGIIYQFFLYIHDNVRAGSSPDVPLRIQIWRQAAGSGNIDDGLKTIPFSLIWQARVQVKTNHANGALYTVSYNLWCHR